VKKMNEGDMEREKNISTDKRDRETRQRDG
jgi:hypothetical protein